MNVNAISHVLLGVRFNKFSNKISNFKQNEVYVSRLPRSFGAAMYASLETAAVNCEDIQM